MKNVALQIFADHGRTERGLLSKSGTIKYHITKTYQHALKGLYAKFQGTLYAKMASPMHNGTP